MISIPQLHSNSRSSIVGLIILGLLAVIAAVIFRQQFYYNPAVTALSATIFTSSSDISSSSGISAPVGLKPMVRLIKSLEPLSASESFNNETLSDKIDGKAELYLPAGFKSLVCQRFKHKDSDLWIELFVYDMGLAQNAFSVFSRQRRDNSTPLTITQYAYQTENALFFAHGHFYLEIIASSPSSEALQLMIELGNAFIQDHSDLMSKKMDVPDLFPSEVIDKEITNKKTINKTKETTDKNKETTDKNKEITDKNKEEIILDKESITLITSDVFGFDRLDQVYTAAYLVNGASMTAFISKRDSSESARKLAEEYAAFLKNFGGNVIDSEIKDLNGEELHGENLNLHGKDVHGEYIHGIEIMDTIEIVFSSGSYLAGVRDAENMEAAKILVRQIQNRINQVEQNQ
ncbi:MAG: hypothetical protein HQK67_04615 [Desulfamplus sp.]|nr:hypothetical protein [Desulfamplus sp.]